MRNDFFVFEAVLKDQRACWVGWPGTLFQFQERTFDQTLEAAGKAGFEIIYNYDQTMYMRGSKRGSDTMRDLSEKVWELAQVRFGVADEKWHRKIEINVARVTKHEPRPSVV